jgi:general secretion pathway protein B
VSFILDALRKSEHERQRQAGPALVEAAVAAPKAKTNVWATAAVALLVVNLAAIGVLLLVKSGDEPDAARAVAGPATSPAEPAPTTATTTPAQPRAVPAEQASVTQLAPATVASPQAVPAPMLAPAATVRPPATRNPLEDEVSSYGAPIDAEAAARAAAPPDGPPAVVATRRGSVVYESLPEANPAGGYAAPATTGTSSLPTADEFTARGGLPELKLELHVYSTRPQERIVFVNGHSYREGDTTQEGAAVEEITRDGVIMNLRGSRFLLTRD